MPRILIAILVLIVIFGAYDRGERLHYGYTGGLGGLIVLILVVGFVFGGWRF